MIKVTYTYKNGVRELVCSGHAGYRGGDALRKAGDPSGEALGMTPHPPSPSAPPPSPQGEGKGGAAAAGGDIVCAAASAITGTLAAVLLRREVYLAPSEEGAVEGGGTPSETEGEITPTGAPQGVISEDGEASSALSIRFRHDAAAERNLSLSLPPSSSASPRMPPLPVCGARYAHRVINRPRAYRPRHFLALPFSAAGGGRARHPSEGGKAAGGVSVSEGAGYCRVTCAGAAAKPYFEFALVGLKKLAEAFPENVRVADFRESEEFY